MAFLEFTPRQVLYQFCSVEAFGSLLASKALWCTDLASANDPRELHLGFQHLLEAMTFVRENEYNGRVGGFFETLMAEVKSGSARQQFFCTCLTLLNDALPMWREYGANGRGLAVGFRPSAITSMPGRLQRVRYLDANISESYRKLVRDAASEFDPEHNTDDLIYWATAASGFLAAVTALKHHTWEYEKEIRLVFAQVIQKPEGNIPLDWLLDRHPIYWEKPLKRRRGDKLIDYKAFHFGLKKQGAYDPSRAIAQVVLGPLCEMSIEDAAHELHKNGFEQVEVVGSECEIRID
jgi:hypothetical protein